jgi:hypothetical protein
MSDLLDSLVQALQAQAAKSRGFLSDGMAHALARVALETIRQHQRGGAASGDPGEGEPGPEAWEATGELRWFTAHPDRPVTLQQAFRRLGDSHVDWRDVPLVLGQPDR